MWATAAIVCIAAVFEAIHTRWFRLLTGQIRHLPEKSQASGRLARSLILILSFPRAPMVAIGQRFNTASLAAPPKVRGAHENRDGDHQAIQAGRGA
ncbi:hypothetical protein [Aurantimonas sp. 22II-16-19i]|uniref:hypothetical protein n=1 Tax=Aurantimonas sp. 22II-16-19i TaxID=1317114 RepID=UPI00111C4BDC|nr:hypothetical protein [Aurantimonas sp. 22II-16-19i]